jgi:hypothetical protein
VTNSKDRFGLFLVKRLASLVSLFMTLSFSLTSQAQSLASPLEFLPPAIRQQLGWPDAPIQATSANVLNLVDYLRSHVTQETIADLETSNPGYNRRDDFGGWIVADSKESCLDTRAVVLVRSADGSTPITYKDEHNCQIVKGLWHDPYAGQDYKLAKAVQIDHVVPLKHVYITGGNKWTPQKRCYYANFIHNDFHLLAVSGHENMSKGDNGPEQYMPPADNFQCQYVSTWMKVKAIWKLISTEAELATIEKVIQDHHCSQAKLEYSEADLQTERDAIENSVPTRCQDFGQAVAAGVTQPVTPAY